MHLADCATLNCAAVQCDILADPENGYVDLMSMVYLSIAYYTCLPGYDMNGPDLVRCESNGNWSSDPPVCIGKFPWKMFSHLYHKKSDLCVCVS